MAKSEIDYPFEEIKNDGSFLEVAPGVFWVRMPLPFALNHINLWVLKDGDGWAIVDTGLGLPEVQEMWIKALDQILEGRPITKVIVTHFHPDHLGQAGWLTEHFNAPLWITRDEWLMGRLLAMDASAATIANTAEYFRKADIEPEYVDELQDRGTDYNKVVTLIPRQFVRMSGGEDIDIDGKKWEVIIGLGHAPEHASLYSPALKILISGDQVLPRITPIIGVSPMEPDGNPLQLFLDTLVNFRHLAHDTLVLPAHGLPFRGLHARLDYMYDHHIDRLRVLLEGASAPITGRQAVDILFTRKMDAQQIRLATMETLSHAHMLMEKGLMTRSARADGVWLYQAIEGARL